MADWNRVDVLHIQIKIAYCARPTMTRSNIYIFIWRRRMAGWFIYLNKWTFKVSDGGPGDFFFFFFFFKSKIHLFSHSHSRADDYISSFLVRWFFFQHFPFEADARTQRPEEASNEVSSRAIIFKSFKVKCSFQVSYLKVFKESQKCRPDKRKVHRHRTRPTRRSQ